MPNQSRVKAFTLAEVLITLVIIGVVAALTIPNVVKNYKKHVIETKLKTAYSILTNMHNASIADNGSLDFSEFGSKSFKGKAYREKYMLPYLKYQSYENKSLEEHGYKNGILYPSGTEAYSKTSKAHIFKLSNGMSIMQVGWGLTKNDGENSAFAAIYYVDIDGPYKGANTMGKDIFCFVQYLFKGIPLVMYGEYNIYAGNYDNSYNINTDPSGLKNTYGIVFNLDTGLAIFTGKRYTREKIMERCKTGDSASMVCGALIKIDGWKVKDDYPWL